MTAARTVLGPSALAAASAGDDHAPVGLVDLSDTECSYLLATASIGRVGISVGALPVILPVNYAVLGDDVIIRTGIGTKLDAALKNAVVAFEIDGSDSLYHEGWSVLVQGRASEVTDPDELDRVRALPLRPWAPGFRDRYVRIARERMSGRRLAVSDRGHGEAGNGSART